MPYPPPLTARRKSQTLTTAGLIEDLPAENIQFRSNHDRLCRARAGRHVGRGREVGPRCVRHEGHLQEEDEQHPRPEAASVHPKVQSPKEVMDRRSSTAKFNRFEQRKTKTTLTESPQRSLALASVHKAGDKYPLIISKNTGTRIRTTNTNTTNTNTNTSSSSNSRFDQNYRIDSYRVRCFPHVSYK